MFQFPNINPIAIDLGFIKISWYALSYVAGILSSWYFILKIIKIKNIQISNKIIRELISNCIIGIILDKEMDIDMELDTDLPGKSGSRFF